MAFEPIAKWIQFLLSPKLRLRPFANISLQQAFDICELAAALQGG